MTKTIQTAYKRIDRRPAGKSLPVIVTLVQNPDTGAPWEEGGDFEWEL